MIGQELDIGDIVIYPDGNPRYGGLKFTIGIVTKMTEKRVTLASTDLVYKDKPIKTISKTPVKLLKFYDLETPTTKSIIALREFVGIQ